MADEYFDELSKLFNGYTKRNKGQNVKGEFFYLNGDNDLEFVSNLILKDEDLSYPIRLTPLAWKHTYKYFVDKVEFILLNPVDTLLEKAILQRGKEFGKHDFEDIQALINNVDIDENYLKKRVVEMKAGNKVTEVLQRYANIKTPQ